MEYTPIPNKEQLAVHLPALSNAKALAVIIETSGPDPHTDGLLSMRLAADNAPAVEIDFASFLPGGAEILKDILESRGVKIFHDAKSDLQFLMNIGVSPPVVFDAALADQLLKTSGGPGLPNLAERDADSLLRLREAAAKKLYGDSLAEIARIEFACVRAVAEMEYAGVFLDAGRWGRLTERTEAERDGALELLYRYSGRPSVQLNLFGEDVALGSNFDSNQYILKLLRSCGIETGATSKRDLSEYADHPLIAALTAYRKATKALTGFLYPIPKMINPATGRLHPRYGQIGAWSGRMSCGGPNIQQIPRDKNFRECFAAPPGKKLIIADYSQIELRVAARISGDRRMIEAYRRGEDLHALTASLISDVRTDDVTAAQRQAAKAVNFGLIFGMGAAGLRRYAKQSYGTEMTLGQAERFRDGFFRAYPGIAEWHRKIKNSPPGEARTISGRKFIFGGNPGYSGLYNTPVQGTAADIMKSALGGIARRAGGSGAKIIAAVHDEILLEAAEDDAPAAAAMLKEIMERAGNEILSGVPCVADVKIAGSWAGK